jgi:O-antigen/teichoic acid export membrane protein
MKKENPAIKYGLIGAILLVAIGIIMQLFVLSYLKKAASNPENFSMGKSMLVGILSLLLILGIFIFCIVKTQKDYRKINPEYTYRQLVGQGLLATLILVLVSTAISYLYNFVISPELKTQTVELTKQLYQNIDMPEDVREKALAKLDNQNPVRQLITSLGLSLLLGMIVTLISAMVLNRRNALNQNQMR